MTVRGEKEIVLWIFCLNVWIKGDLFRKVPSPETEMWKILVLLSCEKGRLFLCPVTKKLWHMNSFDAEWAEIEIDHQCVNGIPMFIAVSGKNGTFFNAVVTSE